ncbi:MAG: hypothetical protein L6R43_14050 [Planctomycetes bacterium]|nr:hypothetical protein [Planctomycetota bacterium]
MPRPPLPAAAAALLLLAAVPARADLIRFIDGTTTEGTVTQSPGSVKIKGYKGKTRTFPASEIKFVEKGELSWDVAARMAREIPADASDSLFIEKRLEIARYLKERKQYAPEIEELERKEYEQVLRKSPDHEEARLGMGHVKWGKWWFKNEKDRDQFRKTARPEEMEPLGYVRYRKTGLWEVKEDVEAIEAGKVKHKGRWMTEDEKRIADGYVKDDKGNWVFAKDLKDRESAEEAEKSLGEKPPTVTSSEHFRFISWLPAGETAQMKELAEKAYAWVRDAYGYPLSAENEGGEVFIGDPIDVFALLEDGRKNKWLDSYGPRYGIPPNIIEYKKGRTGASWHSLGPVPHFISSGAPAEKNRQRDKEADLYTVGSNVTSMIGRIVLDRIRGGQQMPWLSEGTGLVTEIRFHETADCCYVSMTKYREEVADKAGSKAKYFDFMKQQTAAGLDRPMRQIFTLELNDLDWADSVKSWSFIEFLLAKYLGEWKQLVRRPFPEVEFITPAHVDAAIKAKIPKDPLAAAQAASKGAKPKDEGPLPTEPIRVSGPGAVEVTEESKEQRAIRAAQAEAWLGLCIQKPLDELESEWRAWIATRQ